MKARSAKSRTRSASGACAVSARPVAPSFRTPIPKALVPTIERTLKCDAVKRGGSEFAV